MLENPSVTRLSSSVAASAAMGAKSGSQLCGDDAVKIIEGWIDFVERLETVLMHIDGQAAPIPHEDLPAPNPTPATSILDGWRRTNACHWPLQRRAQELLEAILTT